MNAGYFESRFSEEQIPLMQAMKGPLLFSILFHGMIVIGTLVGLPYIQTEKKDRSIDTAIVVDLVNVEEEATTNKPPSPLDLKPVAPEKPAVEEQPKAENKPEQAPKVEAKQMPTTVPAQKPKTVEEKAPPPEPDTPLPDTEAEEKPKPEPEKTEETSEIQQPDAFASVLKNLAEPDTASVQDQENDSEAQPELSPLAKFSQRMAMSEIEAVRQQLAMCWNMLAGARFAENLTVRVKLYMNPDRTVRRADIVDQWRYGQDSFFRAAADSALRAVNNPQCKYLELPQDKYESWKEIVVNFDPSEML